MPRWGIAAIWPIFPARTILAEGFAEGCRLSGAAWSGGETQALPGMISAGTVVLGGSAFGRISPKSLRIRGEIAEGDAIIFLASSGVQTNGLSLCRMLADRLPQGYLTPIGDGRAYGEALLDPSVIYVRYVAACQAAGLSLHYAVHMTGHGWRKLMRLDAPFVYRIETVPTPPPIFDFITATSGISRAKRTAPSTWVSGLPSMSRRRTPNAPLPWPSRQDITPGAPASCVRPGRGRRWKSSP